MGDIANPTVDSAELTWDQIESQYANDVTVIGGRLLVEKADLIAVPHMITAIRFQEYVPSAQRGYVSLEAMVAPKHVLEKSGKLDCGLEPEEKIVYNDGSTGIRRQITKLLSTWKMITIAKEIKEESDYDMGYLDWKICPTPPEFHTNANGGPLLILVRNGLRVSEYDGPTGPASTYYFA